MTFVRAVLDGAFKKCCMRSGRYDGSRRNYFFPRIEKHTLHGATALRAAESWTFMYLRFVVAQIDADSERALGVFHAVGYLRDSGELSPDEADQHDALRWWFNENLERPTRFTTAKRPYHRKRNRALSWFRDTAAEHLARVRGLVAILENHGIHVRILRAERVGYVVYEDEHQIVAEPFADMNC
jgi:hypothetical protein